MSDLFNYPVQTKLLYIYIKRLSLHMWIVVLGFVILGTSLLLMAIVDTSILLVYPYFVCAVLIYYCLVISKNSLYNFVFLYNF